MNDDEKDLVSWVRVKCIALDFCFMEKATLVGHYFFSL